MEVVKEIAENYKQLEGKISRELNLKVGRHHLTSGNNREQVWMELFRQIIPHKFNIKQGVFLIDSKGVVSKEVDLAIFDDQYTPYIFNYGKIHFIPIEAVAMVVQCKSKNFNSAEIQEWGESINKLETGTGGIARMAVNLTGTHVPTQKATKPLKVLCHLKDDNVDNESFDLVIASSMDRLKIKWKKGLETIVKIFSHLNGIKENEVRWQNEVKLDKNLTDLEVSDNPILTLILQLNQVLMLINNPMLFPHFSYSELFRNALKTEH